MALAGLEASVFDTVVFVLSIGCGVIGFFLLSQKGVRMMKGGLLYTISVGLAVIGILLAVGAVGSIARTQGVEIIPAFWSSLFQLIVLGTLFFIGYSAWSTAHKLEEDVVEGS